MVEDLSDPQSIDFTPEGRLYPNCQPSLFFLSFDLLFKLVLLLLGTRLVYPIEEKSEHFDNCFSSDLIK